jgi:hypothetical protein
MSAIGPKRTWGSALHMSAFGGKADMEHSMLKCRVPSFSLGSHSAALRKILKRCRGGIQYVEHVEGHGAEMFEAVCDLGL